MMPAMRVSRLISTWSRLSMLMLQAFCKCWGVKRRSAYVYPLILAISSVVLVDLAANNVLNCFHSSCHASLLC